MIEAKSILGSVNPQGDRIWTAWCRYPKFVHQEHLRQRLIRPMAYDLDFSWSVSSARAIPFKKMLEEVLSDDLRAYPVEWRKEQRGMSGGAELEGYPPSSKHSQSFISPRMEAQIAWARAAINAAHEAEKLAKLGVHKSICNRVIEPFIHVNALCTGTTSAWMNFFGLRLDEAADPTFRVVAEALWNEWNNIEWRDLEAGSWHLPFVDETDFYHIGINPVTDVEQLSYGYSAASETIGLMIKISAARCARLSYTSFETGKRSTIEEDLKLYDKLVSASPMHLSPLEHIATPDTYTKNPLITNIKEPEIVVPGTLWNCYWVWDHPHEAGNLGPGWRQFRKTIPGEAVAPLPEKYREE